jgi:hypothetical protein
VKSYASAVPVQVLSDRKIRNSLVHIDEKLAAALRAPKTGWFIDVAIGRRDQFSAAEHGIDIGFCRTYISSEDKILHLGNEISISDLRNEAVGILATVFGIESPAPPQHTVPIPHILRPQSPKKEG